MKVMTLSRMAVEETLDDLARLRMSVFREWPYLYDGNMDYERDYLTSLQTSAYSVVVGAYVGDWLAGASTGAALIDHVDDFSQAFRDTNIDLARVFYCAESVLLPHYRGQGIGKVFFDIREAYARECGFEKICFCAVQRPEDHALRPDMYRPLDGFWESRGYAPLPGAVAEFAWKDLDQPGETKKPLQFWIRDL